MNRENLLRHSPLVVMIIFRSLKYVGTGDGCNTFSGMLIKFKMDSKAISDQNTVTGWWENFH